MQKRSLLSTFSEAENLSLSDLSRHASMWLMTGEIASHSPKTLSLRRLMTDKLLWFLRVKGHESCGLDELRLFLHYLLNGHKEPGGRWGNPQNSRPVSPCTVRDYHRNLKTFFNWMVTENVLAANPMERLQVPIVRSDQPAPLSDDQINKLLSAAKRSRNPKRDEAIIWLLFDTGMRAAELCSLRVGDIDFTGRTIVIEEGKGRKRRMVPFGKHAMKALYGWLYSRIEKGRKVQTYTNEPDEPVFRSDRGAGAGGPLTTSGLLRLLKRLGKSARVPQAHPHALRHSFSVSFLRNGGNQFTLMSMLGHTNPKMTARYVSLAQADIEAQHRAFSPGDRLKGGAR